MLKLVVIFACLGVSIANGFAILDNKSDVELSEEEVEPKVKPQILPKPGPFLRPRAHGLPSASKTKLVELQASPATNNSGPDDLQPPLREAQGAPPPSQIELVELQASFKNNSKSVKLEQDSNELQDATEEKK